MLDEIVQTGAVYSPVAEILPCWGLTDQVTAVLLEPATVALNWTVCEPLSVTMAGAKLTATELAVSGLPEMVLMADAFALDAPSRSAPLARFVTAPDVASVTTANKLIRCRNRAPPPENSFKLNLRVSSS